MVKRQRPKEKRIAIVFVLCNIEASLEPRAQGLHSSRLRNENTALAFALLNPLSPGTWGRL